MADVEYKSTLDNEEVLKALREIVKNTERTADAAEKSFNKVDKSVDKVSKSLGGKLKKNILAIGAAFAGLGISAAKAFELINGSVEGLRIEKAFLSLAASVGQSGNEIVAAMDRAAAGTISGTKLMQSANLALQLGVAKTPAEFEKLTRSAILLGRALGKDATESLNDLITAAGRKSVQILDNLGLSADNVTQRMKGLAEVQFGRAFEQLSQAEKDTLFIAAALDEASAAADRTGASVEDLGARVEQQKAAIAGFKSEFGELLIIIADSADRLFQFISSDLLGITEQGTGFFKALSNGAKAWQTITIDAISLVSGVFNGFVQGAKAAAEPLITVLDGIGKALTGDFSGLGAARDAAFGASIGNLAKEFDQAFSQGLRDEFNSTRDELSKRYEDIIDPKAGAVAGAKVGKELGAATVDATVDEIDKGADKIARAEEKAGEAREDAAERTKNRLIDIEIDTERDRLKILRDSARDAVEAERDRLRGLEDIRRDHANDISDAQRDLSHDESDIARDGARERIRIERSLGQARLDARIEFERKIADVQRSFEQSAVEAAINVDAIAFARAKRERDNQIEDAKIGRDQRIQDAELTAQREREAQREAQRQAVEDAKREFSRRVEEFRLSLQREIEENNLAAQRKLEDIRIAEQIRLQELAINRQQEIEDAARANQIQLEAIETRLQREIAAVRAAAKAKADAEIAEAKRSAETQARIAASVPRPRPRVRAPGSAGGGIPILHDGGFIGAGQTALVRNDERFFTPSTSGFVATPAQFRPASRAFGNAGTSVTNNNTVNAGFDPNGLSNPETALMVENMVRRVLVEELR